jgi:hypothetical protein
MYNLMQNKDPEGNYITCTFINITKTMWPFFTFNPISKMYMFFPDGEIFDTDLTDPESINITTFYDIFDGFYHVQLRFNLTVMSRPGLNPRYLKYLLTINNNTAPLFVFGKRNYPLPFNI